MGAPRHVAENGRMRPLPKWRFRRPTSEKWRKLKKTMQNYYPCPNPDCGTYVAISEVDDPTINYPVEQEARCPECGAVITTITSDKKIVTDRAPTPPAGFSTAAL